MLQAVCTNMTTTTATLGSGGRGSSSSSSGGGAGGLAVEAAKLLDFNQKLDITLLDNIIGCMYKGTGEQVRGGRRSDLI